MAWCPYLPRNQEAKDEAVVFNFDSGCRTFTNTMWPVEQFYIFQHVQSKCSFSWNLDTKFGLHAAGGILVEHSFKHLAGKIEVSTSAAEVHGGAVRWNPEAKANKFFCFLRMFLLLPVMTQDSRQCWLFMARATTTVAPWSRAFSLLDDLAPVPA